MRLYGAIGFGLCSLLGGWLLRPNSKSPFFYLFLGHSLLTVVAGFNVIYLVTPKKKQKFDVAVDGGEALDRGRGEGGQRHVHPPSQQQQSSSSGYRLVLLVYNQPVVLVFAIVVFCSGLGEGVIDNFLFVRLTELGASGRLLGFSRLITCAAEVPIVSKLFMPATVVYYLPISAFLIFICSYRHCM